MFVLDTVSGRVRVVFTDRHGGVSRGPWASLNLAGEAGDAGDTRAPGSSTSPESPVEERDAADNAATNLARLAERLDTRVEDVVVMRQVHGKGVVVVDRSTPRSPAPVADGLVTSAPGLGLLARAADCVPVAIADPVRGVVAVVHSGRSGTAAGVVPAAVAVMRASGAVEMEAWIGPRVCGACYEVPAHLRAEVAAVEPATWSTTRAGTPALDLAAGVRDQLLRTGVRVHDLAEGVPVCTMESEDLFSYRRQGARSGRQGVWVQVLR